MKLFQMVGVVGMVALAGCAHGTMRGSVAMKASDDEAHVCLGENEVKAGDKITFFKNVCSGARAGAKAGPNGGECTKVKLGYGEIVRTLNQHYSVAKVDPGIDFQEGTIVEKN